MSAQLTRVERLGDIIIELEVCHLDHADALAQLAALLSEPCSRGIWGTDGSSLLRNIFRLTSTRRGFTPHNKCRRDPPLALCRWLTTAMRCASQALWTAARAVAVIPSSHAGDLRAPAPRGDAVPSVRCRRGRS
jgi:hypothetical protein